MAKTYELWGGPADGETGDVHGKVPERLYRRGGGVQNTEYVLDPLYKSATLVRYVPTDVLTKKAYGEIEG